MWQIEMSNNVLYDFPRSYYIDEGICSYLDNLSWSSTWNILLWTVVKNSIYGCSYYHLSWCFVWGGASINIISAHGWGFSILSSHPYVPKFALNGSQNDMPKQNPRYTSHIISSNIRRIYLKLIEVVPRYLEWPRR